MMKQVAFGFTILLAFGMATSADGTPGAETVDTDTFAYHLRLVRVAMDPADAGAAVGWGSDAGNPVLVPSEEIWGSPEQLDAIRDLLGAESAEPVTGFYLQSNDRLGFRFERTVYVGTTVADLSFHATPPSERGGAHRLELRLVDLASPDPPLAEATLMLATDRTVAIAIPGLADHDALVLAVTSLAPGEAANRIRKMSPVSLVSGDVSPPKIVVKSAPIYPPNAREAGLEGDVTLQAIIDRTGVPRAPMILRMTPGCEELAGAAVDAVKRWRYEPARAGDEPVSVWFTVHVRFALE